VGQEDQGHLHRQDQEGATARLTSNGRTIARRTLKAGTRHATFTVTNPSHTRHYRLKITPAS
ncbi:MAG: hypothetical protein QOI61_2381, partial [Actinomycetota bacterium]